MNDKHNQLDWMVAQAQKGSMSRREFVGRTTALGVSTALASALFTKAAPAQEAKKGGVIRVGMQDRCVRLAPENHHDQRSSRMDGHETRARHDPDAGPDP